MNWSSLWVRHRGKIIGVAAAVALVLLLRTLGLFWTLLLLALALAGFWIGSRFDEGEEGWEELLERIWPRR